MLTLESKQEYDNVKISCQADNTMGELPQVKTLSIKYLYKPRLEVKEVADEKGEGPSYDCRWQSNSAIVASSMSINGDVVKCRVQNEIGLVEQTLNITTKKSKYV